MLRSDGRSVRLFTRRSYDWTERFPAIVGTARTLRARSFLIDVIVLLLAAMRIHGHLRGAKNEAAIVRSSLGLLYLFAAVPINPSTNSVRLSANGTAAVARRS